MIQWFDVSDHSPRLVSWSKANGSSLFYWRLWKSSWDGSLGWTNQILFEYHEPLFLPRVFLLWMHLTKMLHFFNFLRGIHEECINQMISLNPFWVFENFWWAEAMCRWGSWRLCAFLLRLPSLAPAMFSKILRTAGAGGKDQLASSAIRGSQWSWDKTCFYQFQGGLCSGFKGSETRKKLEKNYHKMDVENPRFPKKHAKKRDEITRNPMKDTNKPE